ELRDSLRELRFPPHPLQKREKNNVGADFSVNSHCTLSIPFLKVFEGGARGGYFFQKVPFPQTHIIFQILLP
ncbi:MAG: hypothetical protein ACI4V1_10195, partial [Eubacteriales bacterium]